MCKGKGGSGVQVCVGIGLNVCLRVCGCVKGAVARMCVCTRLRARMGVHTFVCTSVCKERGFAQGSV